MYIKELDFIAFAKNKCVKNFPNRFIKEVNGERVNIIPFDEIIIAKLITDADELKWYGILEHEAYMLQCTKLNHFPTELIAGVKNKQFSQDTELSNKSGWLKANGATGTFTEFIKATKINEAITILQNNGFTVKMI